MSRIFLSLAVVSLSLFALTMALGFTIGDLRGAGDDSAAMFFRVHFLLGVVAALGVVLVNSIVVTYFIGTSRWCKEVATAYGLDPDYVRRSSALKRWAFPWALVSMLAVVGVAALGAASDPATAMGEEGRYATWHLVAACATFALLVVAHLAQGRIIGRNQEVIEAVMAEVGRVRREKGLDAAEEIGAGV